MKTVKCRIYMASKKTENRLWVRRSSLKGCDRGIFVSGTWRRSTVPYPKILGPDMFQILEFFGFQNGNTVHMPVPVAARSKAQVYGSSPAEIVGSNPTGDMDVFCCECCVLSGRGLCDGLISFLLTILLIRKLFQYNGQRFTSNWLQHVYCSRKTPVFGSLCYNIDKYCLIVIHHL